MNLYKTKCQKSVKLMTLNNITLDKWTNGGKDTEFDAKMKY